MQNLIKTVTLMLALILLSGCTYFSAYKRDLPQGNLVTEEMVSQLETGMSREQVEYVMGSPLLEAPFNASQWDYVFRLKEAYGGVKQRRVTLSFAEDRLVNIATSGDMQADMELTPEQSAGPAVEGSGSADLPQQDPRNAPLGGEPATR